MQHEPTPDGSLVDSTVDSIESDTSTSNFLDFRSSTRLGEKLLLSANNSQPATKKNGSQDEFSNSNDGFFEDAERHEALLKWSVMKNINPLSGAYGGQSCIFPTKYCVVIGTAKGLVLIFTRKQLLVNTLLPQVSVDVSNNYLRSSVEAIAISSDGTHLAASYSSGDVFLWNLNVSENKQKDAQSSPHSPGKKQIKAIIHFEYHQGREINGLGFVGSRHTGLVISDNKGEVMYHNGFRKGLWSLTHSSKRVLNIPSNEKLLGSRTAPFDESMKSFHMVAILTTSTFAILTTKPHLATLLLDKVPHKVTGFPVNNCCLYWDKYLSKIAYSINSSLVIYFIEVRESSTKIVSKKIEWESKETIICLQWVTEDLLGLLTVSHQFLVLDITDNFKFVTQVDLLTHGLLTSPNKNFSVCNNDLFVSTHYNLEVGKFSTWSDIALTHVQHGDYIGALKFFGSALKHDFPLSPLMKLRRDLRDREHQLMLPFYNLALASLRFLLRGESANYTEVDELLSLTLRIVKNFEREDLKFEYTNTLLEQAMECFSNENNKVFFEVLINAVLEGSISVLPPEVFKALLEYYSKLKSTTLLEEVIIMLSPEMLDIDLAVKLCQDYGLFDVLVYIWNRVFHDYNTPLIDAMYKITGQSEKCLLFKKMETSDMNQIFDYLTFILTGREYPQNISIVSEKAQMDYKIGLYQILFSGTCIELPSSGKEKIYTQRDIENEPAFPYFNLLIDYNAKRLLAMLNEVFEDNFFNGSRGGSRFEELETQVSRQYIVHIILDIMRERRDSLECVLLAIFICSNIAKYPQFIRVSNQALERLISLIIGADYPNLENELQRALEALLTVYTPANPEVFIAEVKEKKFVRVLFTIYNKLRRYDDLFVLVLESENTKRDYGIDIKTVIQTIFNETKNDRVMKSSVLGIIKNNIANLLTRLPPRHAVLLLEKYDPEIHDCIFALSDELCQLDYLEELFSTKGHQVTTKDRFLSYYLQLCCRYKDNKQLIHLLREFPLKNIDLLPVLENLTAKKNYEAAGIVHEKLEDYESVIEDMIHCINDWFSQRNRRYETLNNYLVLAMQAADASKDNKEINWTRLIAYLITLYGNVKEDRMNQNACKKAIQSIFVRLALSGSANEETGFHQFWRILTGALESQEVIMRKVYELQDLLLDIYTAYNIEEHMSRILVRIVEGSSTELVESYKNGIQRGSSISTEECEVCGKILWGVGLETVIFEIWEAGRRGLTKTAVAQGNASSIVVFMCHHGFHEQCLHNLGQKEEEYACLICNCDDT